VLKLRPQALASLELHLVETSPALRKTQRTVLSNTGLTPRWKERLDQIPDAPFILVANEFFDALPIRQFVRTHGAWCERRVALAPNSSLESPRFGFVAEPTLFDIEAQVPLARETVSGQIIEHSQSSISISSQIGAKLRQYRGRTLVIDYGYDEPHGDTLQAVRAHKKAPPLEDLGLADMTAHVDFATLMKAARDSGAETFGAISQANFLQRMGIAERFNALARNAGATEHARLTRQLGRLTDRNEMGELFRVVSFASPGLPAPPGF
jgi:NADH dehydrogenase [ubiquinone] 1 alpha subcomplex assembly factor 7